MLSSPERLHLAASIFSQLLTHAGRVQSIQSSPAGMKEIYTTYTHTYQGVKESIHTPSTHLGLIQTTRFGAATNILSDQSQKKEKKLPIFT